MLLKDFLNNINANEDGFVMTAVVDEDSNSDAPNAKYVLKRNDTIIGEYPNSVKAKEGYENVRNLLEAEGFVENVATPNLQVPVEEPAEEPADDSEEVLDTENNVYDEVEPVEETEDLPTNEE